MTKDALFAKYGQSLETDEVLFQAGDDGQALFVIRSGAIRIFVETKGVKKTLAVLGPGEILGEMSLLNDRPRSATAVALEQTELLVMGPKVFEEMLVHNTEIAVRLIRKMAKRLEAADSLIQVLLHRDPKERIVENLKRLAALHGWKEGESVTLEADVEAMAEQVGLEVGEAQDAISRLVRQGALAEHAGEWTINSPDRLDEFLRFIKEKEKYH